MTSAEGWRYEMVYPIEYEGVFNQMSWINSVVTMLHSVGVNISMHKALIRCVPWDNDAAQARPRIIQLPLCNLFSEQPCDNNPE